MPTPKLLVFSQDIDESGPLCIPVDIAEEDIDDIQRRVFADFSTKFKRVHADLSDIHLLLVVRLFAPTNPACTY